MQDTIEKIRYTGILLRVEPSGFGVIEFDQPIGPSGNAHGIFSTVLGSTIPYGNLKSGLHVSGEAEPADGERKVATVKTLRAQ
jgi:hypothetical protein